MPNRRRAEAQAQALLDEHGISEIPIRVDDLIKAVGAGLVYQRMDADVSGMTFRREGAAVVGINSGHHHRRQRFTAAHELGHIQLHRGRPLIVDSGIRVNFRDPVSSQATDAEEIEANAFAAALLMPTEAVMTHATLLQSNGIRTREKLTTELARFFDVSTEAMGYRLMNLGIISSI